ncbi:MAG: peptidoglycan-binding protein [Lachnospiraceae bacterium]
MQDNVDVGSLQVNVQSDIGLLPIEHARVSISFTGDPVSTVEQVETDDSGQSPTLTLPTPPLEYSMESAQPQPYAEYTIRVTAEGYAPLTVNGTQVLPTQLALQGIKLQPLKVTDQEQTIVITPNTLFGTFPPKIAEAEIKPMDESGEIVLSRVVVPEYVVVHDGPPGDKKAENHYVKYKDYIKNVASSEIYSTWPEATLRANILAIMSFTMNRVYTEWYRNKGYDFTVTSSTAFDQKWVRGRNTFQSISEIVDEIFTSFLARPNVKQPILTQYCDGKKVTCTNWLSQWGSKYLGDQDYKTIDIIRYYYGSDMYINQAEEVSGVPASWPREDLSLGSAGDKVKQMQEQLRRIAKTYTAIPSVTPDGIFGVSTQAAVKKFQKIFGLPVTGIVDYATWYKISELYVGVTRIAELQ